MNTNKSVLVTGGTGNIGSAIVAELLAQGYQVKVLCKDATSAQKAQDMGAVAVAGSLTEPQRWLEALTACEAMIHTACTFDEQMGAIDTALMQAVAGHALGRTAPLVLVYTAGCWAYGSHETVITETTPKHSVADFQWMLDNIAWLSDKENIDLRVVSPANVVREEEHYLPPILSWELERCGHPVLPADEAQTWPLVERKNLAELYRLVLERGRQGEEYIGSAEHRAPLAHLLRQLSEQPIECAQAAQWAEIYGTWTEGYALQQVFSSDKAIRELGWQPKPFLNLD
ncbi:NAD-dependent epimerase/dehydratase family protein [Pseudoalteromonas rubra]|uniref:NAD-dependent epimerase/dehydratase family protein n=1 Tax=Pseudoalteromonas rubra TaxID=43658 RepID=UPI000F77F47B|nr:NAD-dependent epimerase/dehydratase family protein [Pseudoalteromonas rubra]